MYSTNLCVWFDLCANQHANIIPLYHMLTRGNTIRIHTHSLYRWVICCISCPFEVWVDTFCCCCYCFIFLVIQFILSFVLSTYFRLFLWSRKKNNFFSYISINTWHTRVEMNYLYLKKKWIATNELFYDFQEMRYVFHFFYDISSDNK